MREPLRHSTAMLRNPRLVLLHLVLNAALLVSASLWLLIPEARVWQLVLAGMSALLIVFVFVWLHSATLVYAADPAPGNFGAAFAPRIRRLLWFLLGFSILFWLMYVVSGWTDSAVQVSGYMYAKAPAWLRPVSGSSSYATLLQYILAILFWYVVPVVLLPLIACRIVGSGFLRGLRALRRRQYWLMMAATAVVGIWVTSLILGWTPGKTLNEQTAGLVIRFAIAYAIAIAAWLTAAGLVGYFAAGGGTGAREDVLRQPVS